MSVTCACQLRHERRKIVLTGGPGGGKTAVLEAVARAQDASIVICDRGTVDGVAYWPGPHDFWNSVHTRREDELYRYDAVIHLRVPADGNGYDYQNPLRIETAEQAHDIDERIYYAWSGRPMRRVIDPTPHFLAKAEQVGRGWRSSFTARPARK